MVLLGQELAAAAVAAAVLSLLMEVLVVLVAVVAVIVVVVPMLAMMVVVLVVILGQRALETLTPFLVVAEVRDALAALDQGTARGGGRAAVVGVAIDTGPDAVLAVGVLEDGQTGEALAVLRQEGVAVEQTLLGRPAAGVVDAVAVVVDARGGCSCGDVDATACVWRGCDDAGLSLAARAVQHARHRALGVCGTRRRGD